MTWSRQGLRCAVVLGRAHPSTGRPTPQRRTEIDRRTLALVSEKVCGVSVTGQVEHSASLISEFRPWALSPWAAAPARGCHDACSGSPALTLGADRRSLWHLRARARRAGPGRRGPIPERVIHAVAGIRMLIGGGHLPGRRGDTGGPLRLSPMGKIGQKYAWYSRGRDNQGPGAFPTLTIVVSCPGVFENLWK